MKVLISGASVAGPALAFWLGRAGHDVTVIERAPALRAGGYAVDFRGRAHMHVLERMGIVGDLRQIQTGGSAMRYVDADGRTRLFLPPELAGGDLEVRRADLSQVLWKHTAPHVRYVFGETVRFLAQHDDGVDIAFEHGAPQRYDFVFGADGIHSNIRRLTFPNRNFESDLGYHIASWDAPALHADVAEMICYNVPGRMIGIQPSGRDGAPPGILAVFVSPRNAIGRRDVIRQKDFLYRHFADMDWRVPELLATLPAAEDLYFNTISRAKLPQWFSGRVALVGDAAGGVSIGGMGTGSAVVGAYVLAGELLGDPHDFAGAFRRYQQRIEPYADTAASRGEGSGRFLAPRTRLGLTLRDRIFSIPAVKNWMISATQKTGTDIELPDYPPLRG